MDTELIRVSLDGVLTTDDPASAQELTKRIVGYLLRTARKLAPTVNDIATDSRVYTAVPVILGQMVVGPPVLPYVTVLTIESLAHLTLKKKPALLRQHIDAIVPYLNCVAHYGDTNKWLKLYGANVRSAAIGASGFSLRVADGVEHHAPLSDPAYVAAAGMLSHVHGICSPENQLCEPITFEFVEDDERDVFYLRIDSEGVRLTSGFSPGSIAEVRLRQHMMIGSTSSYTVQVFACDAETKVVRLTTAFDEGSTLEYFIRCLTM